MKGAAQSSEFTKIYRMSTEDLSKQPFSTEKGPQHFNTSSFLCSIKDNKVDSSVRNHLTNTAIKCSLYASAVYFSSTAAWLHRWTKGCSQGLSTDFG